MTIDHIPWEVVESASLVHISGITPALSSSGSEVAFESVKRAKAAGASVTVDVNYRAKLWSPPKAREVLTALCGSADLALCTTEDARDVFGIATDREDTASSLASVLGLDRVVVTDGERGAYWYEGGEVGFAESYPAAIVDRVGAGDAFAAGVIIGLLSGDLAKGVQRGLGDGGREAWNSRRPAHSFCRRSGKRAAWWRPPSGSLEQQTRQRSIGTLGPNAETADRLDRVSRCPSTSP